MRELFLPGAGQLCRRICDELLAGEIQLRGQGHKSQRSRDSLLPKVLRWEVDGVSVEGREKSGGLSKSLTGHFLFKPTINPNPNRFSFISHNKENQELFSSFGSSNHTSVSVDDRVGRSARRSGAGQNISTTTGRTGGRSNDRTHAF